MFAAGKEASTGRSQDKGQAEQMKRVCSVVLNGDDAPIEVADLAATTRTTFRILDSLRSGQVVDV
jgi:hypothetical protein